MENTMAISEYAFSSTLSTPSLLDSPTHDRLGTDVDQATVKRLRSMNTRRFGLHAAHGTDPNSQSGSEMKPGPGPGANPNAAFDDRTYHDLQHQDDDADYYDAFDEMSPSATSPPLSPSIPQLPPLPLTPISPRWDSLFHGNLPLSFNDRSTSVESGPRMVTVARSQTSAFPGLSSPPLSSDLLPLVPSSPSIRNFSLLDSDAGAYYRPLTPSSSTTKSLQTDSSPARDPGTAVENFSRPRKPSLRQTGIDLLVPRQRTGTMPESSDFIFPDQHPTTSLIPAMNYNAWHRGRGVSTSSTRSAKTHGSLAHRPSNDQLHSVSGPASISRATPSSSMTRPTLTIDEDTTPSNMRDPPPWVVSGDDEVRSSLRSQLTASTALGTVFTTNGTERSSVLTKTSSVTDSVINNGYARASVVEDDGLSVEDVMGMYENGFHDDSDDEDGGDLDKSGLEDLDSNGQDFGPGRAPSDEDVPRPRTGNSGTARLVDQMMEAMSDALPIPGSSAVPSSGPVFVRDSTAMFRHSGLPSSLPKDIGLGLASERVGIRAVSNDDFDDDMVVSFAPKHNSASNLDDDAMKTTTGQVQSEPSSQPQQAEYTTSVPQTSDPQSSSGLPSPVSTSQLPQEPEEDPSSRDRYGFRKANHYITREQYDTWDASYTDYLTRRRKKWVAYQKDSSLMTESPNRFPPRNAKTKRFVRKGIPPDWRGAAWFYYAGGPRILAKHPGVYDEMVRRVGLEPSGAGKAEATKCDLKPIIVEDIEKDLHRTFPDNVQFKPPRPTKSRPQAGSPVGTEDSQATLTNHGDETSETDMESEPEIISQLRRVLHAFALYNPRIGYCQSLNFLAGLLLLFVESEEHAFWLLNVITRVYLPGTHEMSLEGSKVDLSVLMASLKEALPSVWKQIGGDESEMATPGAKKSNRKRFRDISTPGGKQAPVDPNRLPAITLCMTAWFMSCFIGTLPIETVLRVWDIFFYEGSRTLFRIALTVFKVGEAEIKAVGDPMEMFGVVQTLPRRMLDCNALIDQCYRKRSNFKHLNQDVVEEKRQERRNAIRHWKTAQDADNDAGAIPATTDDLAGRAAAGLDLAVDITDAGSFEVRRMGTLFGKRKDREKVRAEDVL